MSKFDNRRNILKTPRSEWLHEVIHSNVDDVYADTTSKLLKLFTDIQDNITRLVRDAD